MYGVDTANADIGLIEAATLKTTISQIREVKKGETVGYGRRAVMNRNSRIATVRIGYADGYPRALGNGIGKMLMNDHFVPTAGNVCMDMTMLDITDYPEIDMKSEVVVFGKGYSVQEVAKDAQTIPYEIMTGISQRVPRIYFGE
jgi:alanine racemase